LPTIYHRSRLLTVGIAHPTSATLELTDGEFQRISYFSKWINYTD
jgi:hypothetical protein